MRTSNMHVRPLKPLKGGNGTQVPQGMGFGSQECMALLVNLSTFDLCCNPDFSGKRRNTKRAMNMLSNRGGLQIPKECMVSGYDFWVWLTTRAMTNIICLKNLIRLYQVTYDSKRRTAFVVHWEEFGLPNMIFDMHPCGLHVYYPKKSNGQYGFV
jgi:hypothetical protein